MTRREPTDGLTSEQEAINALHTRLLFLEMVVYKIHERQDVSEEINQVREMLLEKGLIWGWEPPEPFFQVPDDTP